MHVTLPTQPINKFKLNQQIRQHALRAYYLNIYTVAIFQLTGTRVVYLSEVKEELFYAGPVLHDYATSMP